ncbi:M20 family metallo-hydrolase [Virgibacillus necropolis]|nr:M20 family metallo-hydrolase [Virgibacillus necropolis]
MYSLEKENLSTGIVSGMADPSMLQIEFTEKAEHAGNTPMYD